MRAGKVASLYLVLILSVAATAVSFAALRFDWFQEWSNASHPVVRLLVLWCIYVVVVSGVLLPLGIVTDRSLGKLRNYIEASSDSGDPRSPFVGPNWLRPVTGAFVGAIDRISQREQVLRNQVRQVEIRHRVAEAEQRHIEAVLHALWDAVLVTDAFNELVVVNEAAGRIFGFDPAGAIHQPIDRVLRDDRLCQWIKDTCQNANFADRRHIDHEISVGSSEEEQTRVFDITLTCVEDHKHEVAGVVTILHDLTREREISQNKSDFVSKASHELRTPLSSIRAYIEMLVDGEATDEASRQEFYKIIHNEAQRLGRLIDNMLNISRIEAGIIQIERKDVDIKQLIGRAVDTLEPQAREKKISLLKRVADVDLSVEGDLDMLYQVVLNLVSNAVKYTPDGGRVTVNADSDNLTRSVLVTVSDTGLGIPPDAIPKLFDKFYRVENYKRIATGTGLGLSLCKHIVETLHDGQIGIESKLGMGSKFWVSIPMRYAGSQAAA